MRYDLYRQEGAPAGSQQLRAQDPAPARRCGTELRKGHQGWERGDIDENRDVGGDGKEYEYGDEHEGRDGSGGNGSRNGREDWDYNRDESEKEREPGLEDVKRRAT